MTFGEMLRHLRKQHHFSQRELAERLGVSFTYLSKLENNRMERPPSEEFIRNLARELDADADKLLLLAERVPTDVADIIVERPESVELLRSMRDLSQEEWRSMIEEAKRRREGK